LLTVSHSVLVLAFQ